MKKSTRIISLLLSIIMTLSLLPAVSAAGSIGLDNFKKVNTYKSSTYNDVQPSDWFYANVKSAYEYGLMVGKNANLFDPESGVTVAETLTIAARLHAIYSNGEADFGKSSPWYQVYADYCKANSIADPAEYDLNAAATRAEFAQILANAMPDAAWTGINTVSDNAIPDVKISDSYGAAVYKLYRAGVLAGNDSKGTFAPSTGIKRSEVSAIVTRMADPSLRISIKLGNEYTVTFDLNYDGKALASQKVFDGEKATEPNKPSRSGYNFIGWYTEPTGGVKFDFTAPVKENKTLYAHWGLTYTGNTTKQGVYYTVTFIVNNSTYFTSRVRSGYVVNKPNDPIVDGYLFYNWYDSNGNKYNFDEAINCDITLYGVLIPYSHSDEEILEIINGYYGETSKEFDTNFAPLNEVEIRYTLSDAGTITIKQKLSSPFINLPGIVGSAIEINHFGGNIVSAEITFHYNPDQLGTISPDDLAIFYYDENGNIVVIEDTIIDTEMCTVSTLTKHDFNIWGVISKSVWDEIQERRYPTLRTYEKPYYNVILALDNSGSMDSGTKMSDCINVANNFIDVLADNDSISLITFGNIPVVHFAQKKLKEDDGFGGTVDNHSYIKGIISSLVASGGTDIDLTLSTAANYFTDEQYYQNILILVSDGQSSVYNSTLSMIEQSGVKVLTVGIGNDVDSILMGNIATATGGSYIPCKDTSELQNAFIELQNVYIGSSIDSDSDGLPDIVESTGMRDQFGEIYKTNPNNPDSDNDGINDGDEMGKYHAGNSPYFERISRPDMKTEIVDDCLISNCYLEYIEAIENNSKLHLVLSSTCSLYRVYPDITTPYDELITLGDVAPTEYIYQIPKYYDCNIEVNRPDHAKLTTTYNLPTIIKKDNYSVTYQHDIYVEYTNTSVYNITDSIEEMNVRITGSTNGDDWSVLEKTIIFDGNTDSIDENGDITVINPVKIIVEPNPESVLEKQKNNVVKQWESKKKELAVKIVKKTLASAKDITSDPVENIKNQFSVYNLTGKRELPNVPNAVYTAFAQAIYESLIGGSIDKLDPIKAPYDISSVSSSFVKQIGNAVSKGIQNIEYTYYDGNDTYRISGIAIDLFGLGTNWCYVYKNSRQYCIIYYDNVFKESGQKALANFFAMLCQLNTDSWKEFAEEYVSVFFKGIGSSIRKKDIEEKFDLAEEIIRASSSNEEAKKFVKKYIGKAADELLGDWRNFLPGGKSPSTADNLKKFIKEFVPNGNMLIEYSELYQRIEENIVKINNANNSGDIVEFTNQIFENMKILTNAFGI